MVRVAATAFMREREGCLECQQARKPNSIWRHSIFRRNEEPRYATPRHATTHHHSLLFHNAGSTGGTASTNREVGAYATKRSTTRAITFGDGPPQSLRHKGSIVYRIVRSINHPAMKSRFSLCPFLSPFL